MQKYTLIDGIPIRYAIEGEGKKTYLILHGFIESIEIFESFTAKLSKKGRVVILDLPGCGVSGYDGRECLTMDYMAEIAYLLLQKLSISKVTLIGHSMGGYIALAMAEKHETVAEGIILLHSTPFAATEKRVREREEDLNTVLAGKKMKLIKVNSEGRFAPCSKKKFANEIEDMVEAVDMSDDNAVAATLRGLISRPSREEYFRRCQIPKLMIFGRQDSYISNERAEEVAAAFPDCKVLWLENSGHMGFIEEPDKIIEVL